MNIVMSLFSPLTIPLTHGGQAIAARLRTSKQQCDEAAFASGKHHDRTRAEMYATANDIDVLPEGSWRTFENNGEVAEWIENQGLPEFICQSRLEESSSAFANGFVEGVINMYVKYVEVIA